MLPIEMLTKVSQLDGAAAVGFVLAEGHHSPKIVDVRLPRSEIFAVLCNQIPLTIQMQKELFE